MNTILENLLYLPLDLESPPRDFLDHLNELSFKKLYTDNYRNCFHVPLMYDVVPGKFFWTPFALPYKSLREWCEDVLLPITGRSRIMIITTPAGETNPPHIDCSEDKFYSTLQHKFRYVLQGNIDDLIFIDRDKEIRCNAGPDVPFVMSGKWPHYMKNNSNTTKFTLALGAPWDGSTDDADYVNLIERSYAKYHSFYQSSSCLQLPDNWQELFEENYNFRDRAKDLLGL